MIWPPFPCWDGGFFFAIYSSYFETAKYGAVFGGMGVRNYPK